MGSEILKRTKHHIARPGWNDGVVYVTVCGRYVEKSQIRTYRSAEKAGEPEATMCHKCVDIWRRDHVA